MTNLQFLTLGLLIAWMPQSGLIFRIVVTLMFALSLFVELLK